jgi:hypothetical protein
MQAVQGPRAARLFRIPALLLLLLFSHGPLNADLGGPHPWWNCDKVAASSNTMTAELSQITFTGHFVSNAYLPNTSVVLNMATVPIGLDSMITDDGGLTWRQGGEETWSGIDHSTSLCVPIGPNADFWYTIFAVRRTGPVCQGWYQFHLNTALASGGGWVCIDTANCGSCWFTVPNPIVPEPGSLSTILACFAGLAVLTRRRCL